MKHLKKDLIQFGILIISGVIFIGIGSQLEFKSSRETFMKEKVVSAKRLDDNYQDQKVNKRVIASLKLPTFQGKPTISQPTKKTSSKQQAEKVLRLIEIHNFGRYQKKLTLEDEIEGFIIVNRSGSIIKELSAVLPKINGQKQDDDIDVELSDIQTSSHSFKYEHLAGQKLVATFYNNISNGIISITFDNKDRKFLGSKLVFADEDKIVSNEDKLKQLEYAVYSEAENFNSLEAVRIYQQRLLEARTKNMHLPNNK